jgi:hypothetical protein
MVFSVLSSGCRHHRPTTRKALPGNVSAVLQGRTGVATLHEVRPCGGGTPHLEDGMYEERSGWVTFAGVLLLLTGSLNVIYGIAAIGDSRFFVQDAQYIISNLNTWGWITLGIGLIQVIGAGSLWRGGLFGRILAICAASISAIAALLSIPAYPFWSLAIFALDIVIIHQISAHGTAGRGAEAHVAPSTSHEWNAMADYKQ